MKSKVGSLTHTLLYPPIYLLTSGLILIAGISLSTNGAGIFGIWPRVIIGLLVFLLPGCYLFVWAPLRDDWDLIDVLGYGVAYSLALITILGLTMRTLKWNISTVETVRLVRYLVILLRFSNPIPRPLPQQAREGERFCANSVKICYFSPTQTRL